MRGAILTEAEADRELVQMRLKVARVERIGHQCTEDHEFWIAEDPVEPLLLWGVGRSHGEALMELGVVLERHFERSWLEAVQGPATGNGRRGAR